jgi:putative peptidoglycan lipid II flippase
LNIYVPQAGWGMFVAKLLVALIVMGCLLWYGMGTESVWLQKHFVDRAIHLAWLVPLGATAYFATLWMLGFRLSDFKRRAAT